MKGLSIKLIRILLVSLFAITFAVGCQKAGPLERAGERTDEVIDNIKEGDAPLKKKGPLEKAGESIDKTINGDSNH